MSYIASGKQEGATVHLGGRHFGNEGYSSTLRSLPIRCPVIMFDEAGERQRF